MPKKKPNYYAEYLKLPYSEDTRSYEEWLKERLAREKQEEQSKKKHGKKRTFFDNSNTSEDSQSEEEEPLIIPDSEEEELIIDEETLPTPPKPTPTPRRGTSPLTGPRSGIFLDEDEPAPTPDKKFSSRVETTLKAFYEEKKWQIKEHTTQDREQAFQVRLDRRGRESFIQTPTRATTQSTNPDTLKAMTEAFIKGIPAGKARRIKIRTESTDPAVIKQLFEKAESLGATVTNYERNDKNEIVPKAAPPTPPTPLPTPM